MIDPLILVRSVHFAATILATGTVWFMLLVAEPAARTAGGTAHAAISTLRRRLIWLIWIALGVTILSGAMWVVLVASDILGVSVAEVSVHGGVWSVLTDLRFGQVAFARLALAVLLAVLVRWPAARLLQFAAAAGLVALPAWIGHAGATPGPAGAVHLASDVVHLLAAGAWLGGLPALAMLLSWARAGGDPAWRDFAAVATGRFSVLGIVSVAALLASGIVNSWELLSGPLDLLTTGYGRLLALKIGLFAAMVTIAAANRYHLTPRLPALPAMRALQRNSLAEIGFGFGVLLVVGALGTMAPGAHVHISSAEIPPDAAFVHIHSEEAMADVTIDPGRNGKTKASIRVFRENLSNFSARSVKLALDPPEAGFKTVERRAVRMPDGTWEIADLDIPASGIWTARVIIVTDAGTQIVLDAPIVIAQCSNECS